ncbi:MAG: addiction module protein [Pseudomonadota bacterium]
MKVEELQVEIGKLDLSERAVLAQWILGTLDEPTEAEIAELWAEEAERRLDELEQGLVEEIPADEVFRRAHAAISKC